MTTPPALLLDSDVAYGEIMLWVQRNPQYFDRAKAKFATEADGWLVAYSLVNGTVVVTNEQSLRSRLRSPRPWKARGKAKPCLSNFATLPTPKPASATP